MKHFGQDDIIKNVTSIKLFIQRDLQSMFTHLFLGS